MSWPNWAAASGGSTASGTQAASASNQLSSASSLAFSGYTPEQWAAAQNQNWQQWAQWQEQYRQWQAQYGDKYTEHMVNFQVSTQPPLPPSAPAESRPPPPPPPEGPPPQTLKGNENQNNTNKNQTASVMDPSSFYNNALNAQYYYSLMAAASGVKTDLNKKDKMDNSLQNYYSSWYSQMTPALTAQSYAVQTQQQQPQSAYISDEEKAFDIQFKKWEEEFEAWKQQNKNHPDKVAYREYEKRFQTCREQLVERKEQMKAKRLAAAATGAAVASSSSPQKQPVRTEADADQNNYSGGSSSYHVNDHYRQNSNEDYNYENGHNRQAENSNFLYDSSNRPVAGIPGLDLVDDRNKVVDLIDDEPQNDQNRRRPDLKAISKGINNILRDSKLLNMLSMVSKNGSSSNRDSPIEGVSHDRNDQINPSDVSGQSYNTAANSHYYKVPYHNYGDNRTYRPENSSATIVGSSQMYQTRDGNRSGNDNLSGLTDSANYYRGSYQGTHQGYDQDKQRDYYERSERSGSYSGGGDYSGARVPNSAPEHQYMDYPILEMHTIVDYQHKSIKPKFLEPVQTFDYSHMSSNNANLKESTKDSWSDYDNYPRKQPLLKTPDIRIYNDDKSNDSTYKSKNVDYNTNKYDDRYKDNVDKFKRNERNFARERDFEKREERSRNRYEDRNRFMDRSRERRDKYERRSDSNENSIPSNSQEQSPMESDNMDIVPQNDEFDNLKNIVMIDDILEMPGRDVRPEKIVIILRGLPGSGKSYLAKLIKDKEVENGGSARVLSIDDYFMFENEIFVEDPDTGRKTNKREMKYEYDPSMEGVYITSLTKLFRRTVTDGYFPFIIVDNVNDQLQHFQEIESIAKQNGFKVYICEMDVDVQTCHKRNIHDRHLDDIERINDCWMNTPSRFTMLDSTTLLQSAAIDHVQMEDVSDGEMEEQPKESNQNEEEEVLAPFSSKWDNMDDTDKLARLDGTNKPLKHNISTMEDFLQLDEWDRSKTAKPGKKTIRWADIEERHKQEKMRAIGFVVGQTDWDRMNDPTQGSSALTQTKYIERI